MFASSPSSVDSSRYDEEIRELEELNNNNTIGDNARFATTTTAAAAEMVMENAEVTMKTHTGVTPQELDNILAEEMASLSMNERDQVFHDLHGVSSILQETNELIQESLTQLNFALDNITLKNAYDQASKAFVSQRDFRLMFLRAENFHPQRAAQRMVAHFEQKQRLFGVDKLPKYITLNDLSSQDLTALYSGLFQILPSRDRAGRAIVFTPTKLRPTNLDSLESVLRAFWYMFMSLVRDDEETQRRGIVNVVSFLETPPMPTKPIGATVRREHFSELPRHIGSLEQYALPTRVVVMHFCYNNASLRPLVSAILLYLKKWTRARTRAHVGTHMECKYNLMTFGIPSHDLPLDENNSDKLLDAHRDWITSRSNIEEAQLLTSNDSTTRIALPEKTDVLYGKGNVIQTHVGNVRFRHVIESTMKAYEEASRKNKNGARYC